MTKEAKTDAELAMLMLEEARKSGKCGKLADVMIFPATLRHANWDFLTRPQATRMENECGIELHIIAARLQQKYNLR